jgi:dipeptidase E
MKLLLTSLGITNHSIRRALHELTGKPIAKTDLAYIPSAIHAMPDGGVYAWDRVRKQFELGWRKVALLELTAFPSMEKAHWLNQLQEADVILVDGGNTPYLSHWLYASGLAAELPRLLENRVYVGVSAGSLIVSHGLHIDKQELHNTGMYKDDQYGDIAPPNAGSDKTLRLVPFTLRPHLGVDYFEHVSMEDMERQAAMVDTPLYAIDDQTAIRVEDGVVTVISEGDWRLFNEY